MHPLGKNLKFYAALAGSAILMPMLAGQTLSPDEVRIRSGPYRPQSASLRVHSDEVQLDVVVRGSDGKAVGGLKPDNFTVDEDGKRQTVSSFSIQTRELRLPLGALLPDKQVPVNLSQPAPSPRAPRYVALYFDDLHTKAGDMNHVRTAAENFIRTGLSVNDRIALFTASSAETVDFTPDASQVLSALIQLRSRARVFDTGVCPRITPLDAYLIVNHLDSEAYDTALAAARQCNCADQANTDRTCYVQQQRLVMFQAQQIWEPMKQLSENTIASIQNVVNYLAAQPGERVLVLASSGFLAGTLEAQVDALVTNAIGAGITINALDAKGLYTEDPSHGQMQNVLAPNSEAGAAAFRHENESFGPSLMSLTAAMVDFTVGTGGRFFHNRNDLGAGYFSLAAAPETEYLLGFAPGNAKANGAYHKLKVELNSPGKFDIEARPGYFAPTKEPSREPTPEEKIDAEVRSSEPRNDFPLSVSDKPAVSQAGQYGLSVQTRVDIQKLPFAQQKDRRVDLLTFVFALFDTKGNMVTGKEAQMQFALKPTTFDRFSNTGIIGGMSLKAPPGVYRLRVVVEEALHSQMSATTQNVQIQ